MIFVFTNPGKYQGEKIDRKYLVDLAEAEGHVASNIVNHATSYLVNGDLDSQMYSFKMTVKMSDALKYGTPVISVSDYVALVTKGISPKAHSVKSLVHGAVGAAPKKIRIIRVTLHEVVVEVGSGETEESLVAKYSNLNSGHFDCISVMTKKAT